MTLLPFSFAESTAASAKRVASVDASLERFGPNFWRCSCRMRLVRMVGIV